MYNQVLMMTQLKSNNGSISMMSLSFMFHECTKQWSQTVFIFLSPWLHRQDITQLLQIISAGTDQSKREAPGCRNGPFLLLTGQHVRLASRLPSPLTVGEQC